MDAETIKRGAARAVRALTIKSGNQSARFVSGDQRRTSHTAFGLGEASLAVVRTRLRKFLAVVIGLLAFNILRTFLVPLVLSGEYAGRLVLQLVLAGLLTVAVAVYGMVRWPQLNHKQALRLGLGFEVCCCLVVNFTTFLIMYQNFGHIGYFSFAHVLVVAYPLIVPCRPRATFLVACICACTSPAAVAGVDWLVAANLPTHTYVIALGIAVTPSVLAFFVSSIVHQLNIDLEDAKNAGAYVLERKLGSGGMGEVWVATHRQLARPAAIKFIKLEDEGGETATQRQIERFTAEARSTARMNSPHTIEVYDFGCTTDGRFFYAMELLEGMTLAQLVETHGAQAPERVIHLLIQICHSLDEAHAAGLVHRDIKPANIFLTSYRGQTDHVKVLDFGLVRPHRQGEGRQATATQLALTADVAGTLAFMPPEALDGQHAPQSDIYAVGCVGYWLLTGVEPLEGGSKLGLIQRIVCETPAFPSTRVSTTIPEGLEQILMSCLEKSPEARPQSSGLLGQQLSALGVGQLWNEATMGEWWRLHRAGRRHYSLGAGKDLPSSARISETHANPLPN